MKKLSFILLFLVGCYSSPYYKSLDGDISILGLTDKEDLVKLNIINSIKGSKVIVRDIS